jgi:GrpB-like predicted nucleotidyltransferase (UPF0157 family)
MLLQLEPYNPQWKIEFEQLRQVFSDLLIDIPVTIEHVGSTAIPGMIAKPILDIDIIPQHEVSLPEISKRLEQAGYISKGEQGIPGRFAFRQRNHFTPVTEQGIKWMAHHLYVCFSNSLALKNHLLFRDALLSNQQLAHNYLQLKAGLLNEPGMTREEYNKSKTDFVVSVLAMNGLTEEELMEIKKANE